MTTVALGLIAIAYLLSSDHEGLVPLLTDVLFLALLGPSVEDALGRVRFGSLCVLVGMFTLGARSLTGVGSPSTVLLSALVVTATVLGFYLLLHPRARVLSLVPLPFATTLVEIPAAVLIGLWLVLQVCFGFAGLG